MTLQEDDSGSSLPRGAPLRPFLCSVPEDLLEEKAYLRTEVFPHLDSLCRARGACFCPVDLQWSGEGATDAHGEKEGDGERDVKREGDEQGDSSRPSHRRSSLSSEQLKISLDLIADAPFFLCILGHRYGLCRPEEAPPLPAAEQGCDWLERNLHTAGRSGHPWVLQGQNSSCSLTELEVTQALHTHGPGTAFFYFRDYSFSEEEEEEGGALLLRVWRSQSEYERRRMREMKGRIVDACLPVRFFRTVSELGRLVRADWTHIVDRLYPLDIPHRDSGSLGLSEHWCHESRVEDLCRRFVPWAQAEQAMEILDSFALSAACDRMLHSATPIPEEAEAPFISEQRTESDRSILLLCGARGCGKSSLVAWWLQRFRKKWPGIPFIPQFPGLCSSSADVRALLRRCTFLLRQAHCGAQARWSERMEERVELEPLPLAVQTFSAAAALGPCVLVLDGLDQLTATLGLTIQQVKELQWLPDHLPAQCQLIITTGSTDLSYASLTRRADVQVLSCPSQSDPAVRRSVLLRHLSLPSAEVPEYILQRIVGRKPALLPVSLAVLGRELRTFGVSRAEQEEEDSFERYLAVETLSDLWGLVILRWIGDYSWAVDGRIRKTEIKSAHSPAASTSRQEGWVRDVLCLLHLSRGGLSAEQLLFFLGRLGYRGPQQVLPQHWALFRSVAGPWIQERPDGQLTFSHQSLGQNVELLLLQDGGRSRMMYHSVLLQGFRCQDCPVRSPAEALEEVAWSLEQSKAWGNLHTLLTDPGTLDFLSRSSASFQLKMDVVRYWTALARAGYDPVSSLKRPLGRRCPTRGSAPTEVGSETEDVAPEGTFITEVEGGEFGVLQEPEVKGRVGAFSAEVLFSLGKVLEAQEMLQEMETLLTQTVSLDKNATAVLQYIQHSLTDLSVQLREPCEAEACCRRALESAQRRITAHPEEAEDAQRARGLLLCKLCHLLLLTGRTDEVPGILQEIGAVNHAWTHPCAEATEKFLQGLDELTHGSAAAVECCFRAALATRRRWYGPEHQLVAEAEEHLADVLAQNCWETEVCRRGAAELYRHVLQVKGQEAGLHPAASPLVWPIGCSLAVTAVKLGKLLLLGCSHADKREAVDVLERAFDLRVRLLSPDHQLSREILEILRSELCWPEYWGPQSGFRGQRSEVVGSGRSSTLHFSGSALSSRSTETSKTGRPRFLANEREKDNSSALTDRPSLIRQQNQNQSRSSQRPWTCSQVSMFGPHSSISDLDPPLPARPRDQVLHKSAQRRLPGRYSVKHPETQSPPKQVTYTPKTQRNRTDTVTPTTQLRS